MEDNTSLEDDSSTFYNTTFNGDDINTKQEQGLISLSTTLLVVDIMSCGIQPIISLLGVAGNSLTVIVLLYQGFQQTTNIILFGLAVTDLLYVLLSLRSLVECLARRFSPQVAVDIDLFSQARLIMVDSELASLSRLYTCFIAVERFVVVLFPLKASRLLTKTRTIIVSGFLWFCALITCFHCFFMFEIGETFNPVQNVTVKRLLYTNFLKQNTAAISLVTYFIRPLLVRYIPIVLVFTCTMFILQTLTRKQLQRQKMAQRELGTDDQHQQQQITKALLAVCVVFLVTNVPAVLANMLWFIFEDVGFGPGGRYQNSHKIALTASFLFMLVNSSVNFMLYVIFNRRFAAMSRQLLLPCWKTSIVERS